MYCRRLHRMGGCRVHQGYWLHRLTGDDRSSEKYGEFEETSPLARIPISGCIGDQHAGTLDDISMVPGTSLNYHLFEAMLGQLCFQPGQVKTTYGTGAFMVCNTGRRIVQSKHGLLTTVCFKLGPNADCLYALEVGNAMDVPIA